MIKATDIVVCFRERKNAPLLPVLQSMSFCIHDGEIVGVKGPNGSGKTTLLKIVCGIIKPSAGNIKVFQYVPSQLSRPFLRMIGVYFPNRSLLWPDLTSRQSFELLGSIYAINVEICRQRYDYLSKKLQVVDCLNKTFQNCSLGQKAKLSLIAAFLVYPKLLILDEPWNSLDPESQNILSDLIREHVRQTKGMALVVSHQGKNIESLCQRIFHLKDGLLWEAKEKPAYALSG